MPSKQPILATLRLKTSDGLFTAHYSAAGLAQLDFPRGGRTPETPAASPTIRRWHNLASRAVRRVLRGRPAGQTPPLDLAGATPFQARVWTALRRIQAGGTQSYGRVAAAIGAPGAARAVGGACRANPVPLLIPCHRVLASDGGLGGFSGGPRWKRKLLGVEKMEWRAGRS